MLAGCGNMREYDRWEYNNEEGTIDIYYKGEVIDRLYIDSLVDNWAEEI